MLQAKCLIRPSATWLQRIAHRAIDRPLYLSPPCHTDVGARAQATSSFISRASATSTEISKSMAAVEDVKLLPLELVFGNARYRSPKISPSGDQLAFLGPSDKDVLNVFIRSIDNDAKEKLVTNDTHRGIRDYQWSEDGKYILYMQDVGGDENWHLYAQPLAGGEARDLTPYEGVRAQGIYTDKHHPEQVLVGLNKRDSKVFDMHRIDIASGQAELDTENPGDVNSWLTDSEFSIRGAVAVIPSNGDQVLRIRGKGASGNGGSEASWADLITWPQEEDGGPVSFSKDGDSIYVRTSLGSDTTRLARVSCLDGSNILEEIARNERCDVGAIMVDEDAHTVFAVAFNFLRREWQAVDPQYKEDFAVLSQAAPGDFSVSSTSADNQTWIASYNQAGGPIAHYLYRRGDKAASLLFVDRPGLQGYQLADMEGVIIKARDGEDVPCYLSLPPTQKREDRPQLPMVLLVHGGPWARDVWGFHPYVAWLTNRGYAVLQVNFRGSTGYGKRWLHLGDKQWGHTMQHDLTDAVGWAVAEGIADESKVAIMGGSYGGYAVLAGLTFTPELYCCGVDIVGPSHIKTLIQTIPSYWTPMRKMLDLRIGEVLEDQAWNEKISPLYHIDKICRPLIIAQGANDPRVKQAESDQIYEAMKAKGLPVEYLLYTDEGHGFARPPNSLDFCSRTDVFLATYLGGRAQPLISPKGSSIKVISEGH